MKKKLKPAIKTIMPGPALTESSPKPKKKSAKPKSNGKALPDDKSSSNGKTNGTINHAIDYTDELDSRELLRVLSEVKEGNFSVRLPDDKIGLSGKICDTLNQIISLNEMLMDELTQAKNTIGKKGHLTHRVSLPRHAKGSWASGMDSINTLISTW
jgi:hypothetical protein